MKKDKKDVKKEAVPDIRLNPNWKGTKPVEGEPEIADDHPLRLSPAVRRAL